MICARKLILGGVLIGIATTVATAAAAAPAPKSSWGKAGITAAQYRADAIECNKQGYYLDIAGTDDAQAFVRGSRELDDAIQNAPAGGPGAAPGAATSTDAVQSAMIIANQQEQIRRSVQPEQRMAHIRELMDATVNRCLTGRGYVRFALSEDQRRHLRHLTIGSEERRAYLYSLASDPAVLAQQRVTDTAAR